MRYNQKLVDRSLTKIQKAIEAEYPNIKGLSYRSRLPEYIEARDIFYYISEKIGFTRTQIGNFMGKSHSTVTCNLKKIHGRKTVGDNVIPNLSERIIIDYELSNLLKEEDRKDMLSSVDKELGKVNEELTDVKSKYTALLLNIDRADLRALLEEMVDLPEDIVEDTLAYVKARKVVYKGNQDRIKIYETYNTDIRGYIE
jgi:hypothetical protein